MTAVGEAAAAPVETAPVGLDPARLAAARLWATDRFPYFATALFSLRPVSRPGLRTFAVDRSWRLYVDPDALSGWSVPEVGAVLVHEVLHLLRDHAGRAEQLGLPAELAVAWNLACDAEINDDLLDAGLRLPGEPVLPADFGAPKARLAEEYLRKLRRRRHGCDCGSGVDGRARPGDEPETGGVVDGLGRSEAQLIRRQVATDIVAARSRDIGSVPDGLARWAHELLRPTVDWRRELASLIRMSSAQVAGCVDYTFTRRSRRAAAVPGVILPGLSRPVPDIAVVVDTSGSMRDEDLARCLAELDGIIAALGLRSRRTHVLAVDGVVQAGRRVARASDVVLRGGGGTDMRVGIAAAVALRPKPQLVVVLTDGFTPWPATPPAGVRVVAALLGDQWPGAAEPTPSWIDAVSIGEQA